MSVIKDIYQQLDDLNNKNIGIMTSLDEERAKNAKLAQQKLDSDSKIHDLQSMCTELRQALAQAMQSSPSSKIEDKKVELDKKSLQEQVNILNEKLNATMQKLKLMESQKQKLEEVLKQKETLCIKLSDKNERLTKMVSSEEKSTKKWQEQTKHKDVKVEEMSKHMDKEREVRFAMEKRLSIAEGQADLMQDKLKGAEEEVASANKLINLLEEKLKTAMQQKDIATERLAAHEKGQEKEAKELISIREEMSTMCETLVQSKKQAKEAMQQLETALSEIQMFEAENKLLREVEDKLKTEIDALLSTSSQLKDDTRKMRDNYEVIIAVKVKEIEEVSEKYHAVKQTLESKIDNDKDLRLQLDNLQRKHHAVTEKVAKYEAERQTYADKLKEKDSEIIGLAEKFDNIQRKAERDAKLAKKSTEELKKNEETLQAYRIRVDEYETKLFKKNQEVENMAQKTAQITDELSKEKHKSTRAFVETDDAIQLLKQAQKEKEDLERSLNQMKEITEQKYANKIAMLEKKCQYLAKMSEYSTDPSSKDAHMKEIEGELLQLMLDNEKVTEAFSNMQNELSATESALKVAKEKVRQQEDLLDAEFKKKNAAAAKNNDKKRLILLEKCIDEILLESNIVGLNPSKLNPREKAVVIVKRIRETCQDLKQAVNEKSSLFSELAQVKQQFEKVQPSCSANPSQPATAESWNPLIAEVCLYIEKTMQLCHEKQTIPCNEASAIADEKSFACIGSIVTNMKLALEKMRALGSIPIPSQDQISRPNEECINIQKIAELEATISQLQEKYEKTKHACFVYKKLVKQFTLLHQNEDDISVVTNTIDGNNTPHQQSSPYSDPSSDHSPAKELTDQTSKQGSKAKAPEVRSSYAAMFTKKSKTNKK